MAVPKQLTLALADSRLVPFVGSGVSCGVSRDLPSWDSLLLGLAKVLRGQNSKTSEHHATLVETLVHLKRPTDAAQEARDAFGSAPVFHEAISQAFPPGEIYRDLTVPRALWALHPQVILTTNYDDVLEAANRGAKSITNTNEHILLDLEGQYQPVIWHLHSSVEDLDSIILARSEYATFSTLARMRLRELFSRRTLLFVGFGFNDSEVLGIMQEVLDLSKKAFTLSFALLDPNDERRFEDKELKKLYGIVPVPIPNYQQGLVEFLTDLRSTAATMEAMEKKAVLDALAQFNRHAVLQLGARHASTHFHFEKEAHEALVAPERTSCGCITWKPLVSPMKDRGRLTVRLFRELLPNLEAGSRAAVFTRDSLREERDYSRTLYMEPFECLLAGLVEDEDEHQETHKRRPIGVVKIENKLPETGRTFDESATKKLLCLIREFTPHLRQAHRWIQKQHWNEARFDIPAASSDRSIQA